jgi:hypothetical protein
MAVPPVRLSDNPVFREENWHRTHHRHLMWHGMLLFLLGLLTGLLEQRFTNVRM